MRGNNLGKEYQAGWDKFCAEIIKEYESKSIIDKISTVKIKGREV